MSCLKILAVLVSTQKYVSTYIDHSYLLGHTLPFICNRFLRFHLDVPDVAVVVGTTEPSVD